MMDILSNDPKIFWYTIFLHKTCIGYPYFPWNPNWSAFHRHDPWPARCPGPLAEWQATAAKLSGLSGFGLKWWVQWILDLILILILHGGDVGWFLTLHSDYWGDGHLRRRKAGDWVLDPSHGVLSHSRPFFCGDIPLHSPEMAMDPFGVYWCGSRKILVKALGLWMACCC